MKSCGGNPSDRAQQYRKRSYSQKTPPCDASWGHSRAESFVNNSLPPFSKPSSLHLENLDSFRTLLHD
jgi:hypothetical protein